MLQLIVNEISDIAAIVQQIDSPTPLRSCREIGSELTLVVQALVDQDRQADATLIEYERLACLLTARATILASYEDLGAAQLSGRFTGLVGYSDGSTWPDPNGFSQEALLYLRDRANATPNPVLKARYHDLLFEKGKALGGHFSALAAIDAYLESGRRFAESELARQAMEMINSIDQATHLALTLGSQEKISEVIQSLILLIEGQAKPPPEKANLEKDPGGRSALELARILLFVRRSRKFGTLVSDAQLERVKDLIRGLAERSSQAGFRSVEVMFLQVAAEAARLLKEMPDEYALELRCGEAIIRQGEESEARPPGGAPHHLIAASFYEDAAEHFQRMRERLQLSPQQRAELLTHEDRLKARIREMYRLGRAEMGRVEVPIEVPADEVDRMLEDLLSPGTLHACLDRIAREGSLLPNLALAQQTTDKAAGQGSLLAHLPIRTIQNDMTVSVSQTEQERHTHEINRNLMLWIQVNSSIILTNLFSRLEQQKGLSAQSLTDYFASTGLFDEDNLALIQTGMERHFAGDYIGALHVLVPQFEDALRTLFQRAGKGVIRPRRGQSGWEMETLGAFLDRDAVRNTLPPEIHAYIRLVMTEQIGLNLRNRIAHGLIRPQDCNIVTSVTVLHLFLLLTLFRLVEETTPLVEETTQAATEKETSKETSA